MRALTRVANAASEEGLLELAGALTASQLERALRVYRRVAVADARESHELEFVDYYFEDDGSLYLRARLPAEDGTLLVKALEAARERVVERCREERRAAASDAAAGAAPAALTLQPPRPLRVEALVELAERRSPRPTSSASSVRGWSSTSMLPRWRLTAGAGRSSRTAR